MTHILIPKNVEYILSRLEEAGHRAYIVGGCVRDSLMGRIPEDWDVTCSALPEETMAVFGELALPTGLKHGTVTVKHGGNVEVTTFRADGQYSDHRRPDSVRFVNRLEDDLARRDFTMNAIAMDRQGRLADPFGGQVDIISKAVRCVGKAEERFEEDALRMFRALRFSSKLGFEIERDTLEAIYKKAHLAESLAVERIETELSKMLMHSCGKELEILFSCGLMERFCPKTELDLSAIEKLPAQRSLRYAGLCALLEDAGLINAGHFLSLLRCDRHTVQSCERALGCIYPESPVQWKKLLYAIGEDACFCAAAAAFVRGIGDSFSTLQEVLNSGQCCSMAQLAVGGNELAALGLKGKDIGLALEKLLIHVIEHPEDNQRETLLKLI